MNAIAFILIKIASIILGFFKNKHKILKIIYLWAWSKSHWWMIITMFM